MVSEVLPTIGLKVICQIGLNMYMLTMYLIFSTFTGPLWCASGFDIGAVVVYHLH